jgi:Sulfotransferase domain
MLSINNWIINAAPWSWKDRVRAGLLKPRLATSRWRTLPDFVIIGGQRCGTTSLYWYLMEHPLCIRAFEKEVHFFDNNYGKGLDWYRANFPMHGYVSLVEKLKRAQLLSGEASPLYMFHPLAPKRVAEHLPQAKLIALLRNPVDRAYSHFQHEVRLGSETLGFEQALDAEEERLQGERDRILEDQGYPGYNYAHYSYATRGIYIDQLLNWLQYFPREQLKVIRSEDLYAEPERVLPEVQRFLGLPIRQSKNYKTYNKGHYDEGIEARAGKKLGDFFASHNQELYRLLGWDLGWDR